MLKYYGATNVKILNGGLKKWLTDGRATVENTPIVDTVFDEADGDYSYAEQDPKQCLQIGDMHKLAEKLKDDAGAQGFQIVDAREKKDFDASGDGKRSNIENSINLPIDDLLNQDGTLKSD